MAAGEDDNVGVGGEAGPFEPGRDRIDRNLDCLGKAIRTGEFLPVVEYVDVESDGACHTGQVVRHVPRTDQVKMRRRLDRLDVHLHLASTDQPGFLGNVIRQLVAYDFRLAGAQRLARLPEGIVLVASAADGAHDPAVGENHHLGPDALGRRALGANDGHQRGGFPALQRLTDRVEDFFVHGAGRRTGLPTPSIIA